MVSPFRRNGHPQPGAEANDGAQSAQARARKERKYRELLASRRCRLVVLSVEVGGRWSEEAATFVRLLAKAKARAFPPVLRRSVQMAYTCRWTGLLAVAALRAYARTLLDLPVDEANCDGEEAPLEDVLREARFFEPPEPSRLPAAV